jgi:SP family sugar:H+ symporter-like MFS transporter
VLEPQRQSIITSLLSAGTFFGAILQSFTADRLGRKYSIMFWGAIFTVGTVIQTAAFGFVQLTVGRFFAGLGVGALSAIVPLYIGEAAPKKIRGTLLVLYQVQIISGLFLAYIVNFATHKMANDGSWRIPIGLQLAWGLVLMAGAAILPESPRLLLGKGREEDAYKAIASLNDCPVDSEKTREVALELEEAIAAENAEGKASWVECFSIKNRMFHRTMNGMMIQVCTLKMSWNGGGGGLNHCGGPPPSSIFALHIDYLRHCIQTSADGKFLQQMNGQNFYYYYAPVFFKNISGSLDAFTIQLLLGGVSFAMVMPAMWTIEHMGRRSSLLIGAACMAVCAVVAGLVGHFYTDTPGVPADKEKLGSNVLVAFAILHVSFFSWFWGPTVSRERKEPLAPRLLTSALGHPRRDFPPARSPEGHCPWCRNELGF